MHIYITFGAHKAWTSHYLEASFKDMSVFALNSKRARHVLIATTI